MNEQFGYRGEFENKPEQSTKRANKLVTALVAVGSLLGLGVYNHESSASDPQKIEQKALTHELSKKFDICKTEMDELLAAQVILVSEMNSNSVSDTTVKEVREKLNTLKPELTSAQETYNKLSEQPQGLVTKGIMAGINEGVIYTLGEIKDIESLLIQAESMRQAK